MSKPWPTVPLRRIAQIVNGGTPSPDPDNWDGEVPWATPVDLAKVDGGVLIDTQRTLTRAGLTAGSSSVPAGSIVVSTRAPIGYIARVDQPTAFNQGCRGIVPGATCDVRFLQYALQAQASTMQSVGTGSTFLELSTEALAGLPIPLPPLDEQRRIANYLDDETTRINQAIALRQREVKVLTERFEAFVIDRITTSTAAHAKAELRRFLRLVRTGTTPSESAFADEGVAWYSPESIDGFGAMLEPTKWVAPSSIGRLPVFPPHCVVIVGIGASAGRVAMLEHSATANQQITALVPTEDLDSRFLMWQLHVRRQEVLSTAPFTTLPILNNGFLGSLRVSVPSKEVQGRWAVEFGNQAAHVRNVRQLARDSTAKLEEHKRAVVSAAVAGAHSPA